MNHPIRSARWLATALLVATMAVPAVSRSASQSTALKGKDEAATLVQPGTPAIPFTLSDLDGKEVSIATFAGQRAALLTFWSFFCGPCREEIPLLDEVTKKFPKTDIEMLAINLDGPKMDKAVRKYMASNGFSFRVLWEKIEGVKYLTADAYGVAGTPTLVLVGRDGKIAWAHVGRVEAAAVEAEIKKGLKPAE